MSASKLRNVIVPIVLPNTSGSLAVMKIKEVRTESRRMGFYRVRLLPVVVMEDLDVELRQPAKLREMLAALTPGLEPFSGRRAIEIRNLRFLRGTGLDFFLIAKRARPVNRDAWQLEGVDLHTETEVITIPSAKLQITGASAGMLTWKSEDPPRAFSLLSLRSTRSNSTPDIQ